MATADDLVYLRFYGPSGNYKGSYSESFLHEYASYVMERQDKHLGLLAKMDSLMPD